MRDERAIMMERMGTNTFGIFKLLQRMEGLQKKIKIPCFIPLKRPLTDKLTWKMSGVLV